MALPILGGIAAATATRAAATTGSRKLTAAEVAHLKKKGFTQAARSLGASFTRTGTGQYVKESEIDEALADFGSSGAAVSVPSATGGGTSSELSVLKSIDKHLQQIVDALSINKQKKQASEEEAATEGKVGDELNETSQKGSSKYAGVAGTLLGAVATKNPISLLVTLAATQLIPIAKMIAGLANDLMKIVNLIDDAFSKYLKPFFTETLPKFFLETLPDFFTTVVPNLFKKGMAFFKEKFSGIKSLYDKVVGSIKEEIEQMLRSFGENSVVKAILGEDNWFKTQGDKLSGSGTAQVRAGMESEEKRSSLVLKGENGQESRVTIGEKYTYKGKEFTVPNTQEQLNSVIKNIDQDAVPISDSSQGVPGQMAVNDAAPIPKILQGEGQQLPGASSVEKSTPVPSLLVSNQTQQPEAGSGGYESSSPQTGSNIASAMTTGESSGAALSSASAAPVGGGSAGATLTAASMAATEPEPMPIMSPNMSRGSSSVTAVTNPHSTVNDITSVPDVSPILGSLAGLLYFDPSTNNKFTTGFAF